MGGRLSKKENTSLVPRLLMSFPHVAELGSSEVAPNLEPNIQYFGHKCLIRNTLGGYEVYADDFKYLNEAIRHLLEGNHEVVKIELLRKNELSELVMKYFTYCASLKECLNKASEIRLAFNIAVGQSEQEERCLKGLEEIEDFKEFFQTQLMMTQGEISKKLKTLNKKVNKRLKSVKRWRKALAFTSAAVSVVAPFLAVMVYPLATALVQASLILLEFIGRRFDSFWKRKENDLEGKKKVIRSMELKDVEIQDLNNILDQIYEVGIEFESLFHNAHSGEEEGRAKKLGGFLEKIEDLCKQAEMYNSYIENAKKGVLRNITEDPPK